MFRCFDLGFWIKLRLIVWAVDFKLCRACPDHSDRRDIVLMRSCDILYGVQIASHYKWDTTGGQLKIWSFLCIEISKLSWRSEKENAIHRKQQSVSLSAVRRHSYAKSQNEIWWRNNTTKHLLQPQFKRILKYLSVCMPSFNNGQITRQSTGENSHCLTEKMMLHLRHLSVLTCRDLFALAVFMQSWSDNLRPVTLR